MTLTNVIHFGSKPQKPPRPPQPIPPNQGQTLSLGFNPAASLPCPPPSPAQSLRVRVGSDTEIIGDQNSKWFESGARDRNGEGGGQRRGRGPGQDSATESERSPRACLVGG